MAGAFIKTPIDQFLREHNKDMEYSYVLCVIPKFVCVVLTCVSALR